jgi:hypothetical protein
VKEYFWFINKQTIMMTHSKNLFLIIVLATMSLLGTTSKSFGQHNLDIKVTNIKKNAGKIIVEIYDNKSEWLKKPYKKVVLQTNQEVQVASFNVPYGKYAITIYQDLKLQKLFIFILNKITYIIRMNQVKLLIKDILNLMIQLKLF